MVLEYIDSTPLAEADLSDVANLGRVIDLIKRAHVRIPEHLRGPALSFSVFHILRDYAATLREQGSAHQTRLGGLFTTRRRVRARCWGRRSGAWP